MIKDKHIKIIISILCAVFVLGALAVVFSSCNPVKQVLKDEYKMRKVWNEGALDGWCVNDTTIVSKSDTLVTFDTLYSLDFKTDTFNIDHEVVKVKTVTKTVKIRDTIKQVVTDNSRVDILNDMLNKCNDGQLQLSHELDAKNIEFEDMKVYRNRWRFRFFLLALAIAVYLLRKPILKLISPIKF